MDSLGHASTATELTLSLARRGAALRYETLPSEIRRVARHCILDFFAVTLAGKDEPLVDILLADLSSEPGAPTCSVIGRREKLPSLDAALVNGAASHALDYDDVNMAMPGHPSVAVLPALLAVAEKTGRSGRDLIEAFVAGYETQCSIGKTLQPGHYDAGFHATATVGAMGSAAACAHLLGLDAGKTALAIGIAATQAAGLRSMFGTMCKPLHAGKASMNGLRAARLAALGFTSRANAIEIPQGFAATHGPHFNPEAAFAEPPGGYYLRANLFKYHAACYLTHAAIDAAGELRHHFGIDLADVERAAVRLDGSCHGVCNIPEPRSGLEVKFSLRHMTAMALAGVDTAALHVYTDQVAEDPVLNAGRERITVDFQSGWSQTVSELVVHTRDGRRLEARRDAGIPAADLDEQENRLIAKFRALVGPVLGDAAGQRLEQAILELDQLDDTGELLRAAHPQ